MQCTAHFKVLEDIFTNKVPQLQSSIILSALFGVTTSILTEYNDNLKSNQFFFDWFSASTQNQRFKTIKNGNNYVFPALAGINPDHFVAAFYSNLMLIYSTRQVVEGEDKAHLSNWGVATVNATRIPTVNCTGDNPLLCIHLTNGGRKAPNQLKPYLAKEKSIIVYDKFINSKSLDVLKELFNGVDATATVTIVKSDADNVLNSAVITASLKAVSPSVTVNVHTASKKTSLELHDRYIFVGDRYVIKFTKGIDCFYKERGVWCNKIGDVIVEDNQQRYTNYLIELDNGQVMAVKLTN